MINQKFDYLYAKKGQVMGVKAYRYADITLASVAMSSPDQFRLCLPKKYQNNKITHILSKTKDNRPVFIKVIEGVKEIGGDIKGYLPDDKFEWIISVKKRKNDILSDIIKNPDLHRKIEDIISSKYDD